MRKLAIIVLALGLAVWFAQRPRAVEESKLVSAKIEYRAMTRGEIEKLSATDDRGLEGMGIRARLALRAAAQETDRSLIGSISHRFLDPRLEKLRW